ncbi:MAG: peptidyl-prolyl cis-trans isomerase [Alphaproteobacteria bacterium]|nr:peptidyl-prolyl cis-trans isomerase [Alphaproteobacteria bacterium]
MVMQVMRQGRFSGLIKFGFITLLVLGTFGLVLSDVRGVLTGGVSGSNVAAVGGETISLTSFDRTLNRTLPRIGISPQESYQLGYTQQLLNNEMRGYALQIAAKDIGIEVSRDQVAKQVASIINPIAGENGNKQEVLEQVLRAQGLTEPEFVAQVGRETASSLLTGALSNAIAPASGEMLEDLYLYENETRDVELIAFRHEDFKLEQEPDEAALKTAYEGLKENFAIPESRDVKLMVINDEALKAKVDVSEEELRRIYDEDKNAFVVQETRKVEQAILKEEIQAQEVAKLAEGGKALKEAVKDVTGDEKAYIGDIDFEKDATQAELRTVVFDGKNIGKVLPPTQTPLGYHVMIVKKITPPAMKPFSQVKSEIKKEQLEIKTSDQIYDLSATLDDLLAGGATMEEIQSQVPLKTNEFKGLRQTGQNEEGKDLLADFKDDASEIVQTAFGLLESETSPVLQLKDGRYAVLHVSAITPKTYKPYDDVKDELKTQTIASDKATQNRMLVKSLQEKLDKGETTFSALSEELKKPIKSLPGLKKQMDNTPEPLIPATLNLIFAQEKDQVFTLDIKDGLALIAVTKTALPEKADKKSTG